MRHESDYPFALLDYKYFESSVSDPLHFVSQNSVSKLLYIMLILKPLGAWISLTCECSLVGLVAVLGRHADSLGKLGADVVEIAGRNTHHNLF